MIVAWLKGTALPLRLHAPRRLIYYLVFFHFVRTDFAHA